MKHWATLALFVTTAIVLGIGWRTRSRLNAELANLLPPHRELRETRRAHEQLQRLQPSAAEWDRLHQNETELARLRVEIAQSEQAREALIRKAEARARGTGVFPLATWVPTSTLKNYGRASPQSLLQTALGAAADGDLELLKNCLAFDPEARKAADKVLAQLPESTRSLYRESEQLMALFTAKNIPAEVQLVSEYMQGLDDATAFLGRKTSEGKTDVLSLRLHRSSDGWRLMVPTYAVEQVGRELAGLTPPPVRGLAPPQVPEPRRPLK